MKLFLVYQEDASWQPSIMVEVILTDAELLKPIGELQEQVRPTLERVQARVRESIEARKPKPGLWYRAPRRE